MRQGWLAGVHYGMVKVEEAPHQQQVPGSDPWRRHHHLDACLGVRCELWQQLAVSRACCRGIRLCLP